MRALPLRADLFPIRGHGLRGPVHDYLVHRDDIYPPGDLREQKVPTPSIETPVCACRPDTTGERRNPGSGFDNCADRRPVELVHALVVLQSTASYDVRGLIGRKWLNAITMLRAVNIRVRNRQTRSNIGALLLESSHPLP